MSLRIDAYAKVNLALEVLGKRPDGYHEIVSVLQTISLADTLVCEPHDTLQFRCDVPGLQSPDNLVLRAAEVLQRATGVQRGSSIHLRKRIPVAAGLGSGATDAAAALVGLDRLWGTHLPADRLAALAADLGSDVPFFLCGGTALARGRGDRVSALPPPPEVCMVVLKPDIVIAGKTARLYSMLNAGHFSDGDRTERLAASLREGGDIEESLLYNVFESVAFDCMPELPGYRSRFLEAGAARVHLAGAGPALFALVPGEAEGRAVRANLESLGLEAYVARTVDAKLRPSESD
jgi:4-diphosphocytidyl-2-C-methyl-D-erythritol kinase